MNRAALPGSEFAAPKAIPLHPEATHHPATLRWVVPAGSLHLVGDVAEAPGDLGQLLTEGQLASLHVEPDAVLVTLAGAESLDPAAWRARWRLLGGRVRTALLAGLAQPDGWRAAQDAAEGDDAVLARAVEQTLAGPVGDYLRSHGGWAKIARVRDGCVELTLGGTCAQCPARGLTLAHRLETDLRRRYPALRRLHATEERGPAQRLLSALGKVGSQQP